jgi:hypothetical protein
MPEISIYLSIFQSVILDFCISSRGVLVGAFHSGKNIINNYIVMAIGAGDEFFSALIDQALANPFPGRSLTIRNLFGDGQNLLEMILG